MALGRMSSACRSGFHTSSPTPPLHASSPLCLEENILEHPRGPLRRNLKLVGNRGTGLPLPTSSPGQTLSISGEDHALTAASSLPVGKRMFPGVLYPTPRGAPSAQDRGCEGHERGTAHPVPHPADCRQDGIPARGHVRCSTALLQHVGWWSQQRHGYSVKRRLVCSQKPNPSLENVKPCLQLSEPPQPTVLADSPLCKALCQSGLD